MRVVSWNVNGIRKRSAQVIALAQQITPDVLCLQELKATPDQIPPELGPLAFSDYWSFWHGGPGGYSGVSLHLRKQAFPEAPKYEHPSFDHECRVVQCRAGNVVFTSMYLPNGGKDFPAKIAFMKDVPGYVRGLHEQGLSLVLCGDLNVAIHEIDVHPSQRKPDMIGQRPEERELLQAVLDAGLTDVFRVLHPEDERMFTWWPYWRQARERNLGWRLDYVLASAGVAERAEAAEVKREHGTSDHAPVVADFREPGGGT